MAADLLALRRELKAFASPARAKVSQSFFRTGPGEYGEGDLFLGVPVPGIRRLARTYRDLPARSVTDLLDSKWHEERHVALFILVEQFRRVKEPGEREALHRLYLSKTARINNWDLVDCSAEFIVGAHLDPRRIDLLKRLARSPSLWERRIAILSTFHWIKRGEFAPALEIAHRLLDDPHDLIHKAVGWMLREVGNRDRAREEAFLLEHYPSMPRTMLRYAIERFPERRRQAYLRGTAKP